jgi:Flp pilus assembly protein TadG
MFTPIFRKGFSALRMIFADEAGNFAMMTAILVPVLAGSAALSVDVSNIVVARSQLQEATDAASLAVASSLADKTITISQASSFAADFVSGQMSNYVDAATLAALKSKVTANANQTTNALTGAIGYTVSVNAGYNSPLSGLSGFFGYNTWPISASSGTASNVQQAGALSMYLVLDRSGSMSWVTDVVQSKTVGCQNYTEGNWSSYPNLKSSKPCYTNKSSALKAAAASLFDELDAVENINKLNTVVRTGAVSFNDAQQTPSALANGTTAARTYVNSLPAYPTGGTDMTTPMATAYNALNGSSEKSAQEMNGNGTFQKFIVLMTDGENTGNGSVHLSSLDNTTLTTCSNAKSNGITIFTVAFMAPDDGKSLLSQCASTTSDAYTADTMEDLVAAFKDIGAKASDQTTRLTN